MTTADLHTLTGAYALHALPEAERARFERHLAACPACAREVAEFAGTATRLGLAASLVPPPEMREHVLRGIASVRQVPPAGPRPAAGGTRGVHWFARRATPLVLAACVSVAAALGGVAAWQHHEAEQARDGAERAARQARALTRVLSAPDATMTSGRVADGGVATVVTSRSQDRAAVVADTRRLPEGSVYQMWFDDAGTMRPAGLLGRGGESTAAVMSGAVNGARGMGITVEPAGGSPRPTTTPVVAVRLPA
ncbi:anti-sigma factor domain-containing protein [Streptomyces sp. NPDC057702]|uniref:anti-sigma factor n=1 Tax=unclassified Streptomyces TaxID=2593676 RepID=UPI0036CC3E97